MEMNADVQLELQEVISVCVLVLVDDVVELLYQVIS